MDKNVLFVCSGNICRSPAAEGIFRALVHQKGLTHRLGIDSAGTIAYHSGEPADARMREAARKRGYRLTGTARAFSAEDFERFDLILAMDDGHYEHLRRLAPDLSARNKVERMTFYCQTLDADHVPDPYYGGQSGFENVLDILEDACDGLLESLISEPKEQK